MRISYDFHIHTDASPCGDASMTPHNIITMAKLLEKQVIAITDHNTCANCEVLMKVGKKEGIMVIPGMEVECMEEFHLIALFPTIEKAYTFEKYIKEGMLPIKNKPHIFGNQYILNENDEVVGEIEQLLLTAAQYSVDAIYKVVEKLEGVLYPAHIDRNAYSIVSNLGSIPEDIPFKVVECSKNAEASYYDQYKAYRIVVGSDAHYIQDMCQTDQFFDIEVFTMGAIFKMLREGKKF